jgi:predicted choloylglycine hydrolase
MFKTILKIAKYVGIGLLGFILVTIAGIWFLVATADMRAPEYTALNAYELEDQGAYKQYGPNFLRKSKSGLWEMYVEGDAFERGEAIGNLTEDLLYFQEKVFVDQIREIIPSDSYLKFLHFFITLFNRNLGENVIQEFREEIYAISLSCTHEYDMIGTPYERQLNYHAAHDLGHAMQDYMLVGCTSFATWGNKSADSSLIVGRNFDFYMGERFAQNKLVAFYNPANGYKFATVCWPGMTGVLSGMNEQGLTVTINASKSTVPTSSATPISLLTREILQYAKNIDEAYKIAQQRKTFVAESILIGSAHDRKAAIIEKSPEDIVLFSQDAEQQVICTNHYQSDFFANEKNNVENINTSDSPYRFQRMQELLAENYPIDEIKSVNILRNYKGLSNAELGLANEMAINQFIAHHSVVFKPEKRILWVSTSPWQSGKYVAYDLNKIFGDTLNYANEIYTEELTIPEDAFLHQAGFQDLLIYKKLTPIIKRKTATKTPIGRDTLQRYQDSNPQLFYTHEVLGDYYNATGNSVAAKQHWKKALTLPIPKQKEKQRIKEKINEP